MQKIEQAIEILKNHTEEQLSGTDRAIAQRLIIALSSHLESQLHVVKAVESIADALDRLEKILSQVHGVTLDEMKG